jgi:hypothetical protein
MFPFVSVALGRQAYNVREKWTNFYPARVKAGSWHWEPEGEREE